MPFGMKYKRRYCYKCGTWLSAKPYTRTVSYNSKEYERFRRVDDKQFVIGDIELTTYDYVCPHCKNVTRYEEQLAISRVQKKLKSRVLSEEELEENIDREKNVVTWKKDIWGFVTTLLWLIGVIVAAYHFFFN